MVRNVTCPRRKPRRCWEKFRPRDAAGKTRRRVAAELITDLERVYARSKAADKELKALLEETGTTLTQLRGIGPRCCSVTRRGW